MRGSPQPWALPGGPSAAAQRPLCAAVGTGLGTSLRVCLGTQEHSPVHYPADDGGGRGGRCSLDNNHSHFILVEPGPPGKGDGQVELWLRLEKHISEQRTGYGGELPGGHRGVGASRRGATGEPGGGAGRTTAWAQEAVQAEGVQHGRASAPGPAGAWRGSCWPGRWGPCVLGEVSLQLCVLWAAPGQSL